MTRSPAAIAGLLIGLTLLAGCTPLKYQNAEPPRVTLSSLELTSLNLLEQGFNVGLRMRNPNDFPLPVEGMEYTILLGGEPFASGVTAESVDLPAYGEQVVTLSATTNLLGNLKQFRQWQSGPPDSLDYQIKGKLSLRGMPFRMPFDYAGEVPLTASP